MSTVLPDFDGPSSWDRSTSMTSLLSTPFIVMFFISHSPPGDSPSLMMMRARAPFALAQSDSVVPLPGAGSVAADAWDQNTFRPPQCDRTSEDASTVWRPRGRRCDDLAAAWRRLESLPAMPS